MDQDTVYGVSEELDNDGFELLGRMKGTCIRQIGEESSKPLDLLLDKMLADDILVGDNDLAHWNDHHHKRLYGEKKRRRGRGGRRRKGKGKDEIEGEGGEGEEEEEEEGGLGSSGWGRGVWL
ncbi:hypothetical protein CerSpe_021270 [Prunus speciosa]